MPELIAFEFGDFTVDLINRELHRRVANISEPCELRPQCFELLAYLLANRNMALANRKIWHNLPKDPDDPDFTPQKLSRAVWDLKKIVGEAVDIDVPRQGFRRLKCDAVRDVYSGSLEQCLEPTPRELDTNLSLDQNASKHDHPSEQPDRNPASQMSLRVHTIPALPANFVPRPSELAALRLALFAPTRGPGIALTAYEGMGGIGKTILAQAVCHDDQVKQAFPDGISWITLGREFSHQDLIQKIRELGKGLGIDLSQCDGVLACGNRLKTALRHKSALIVVDDIWRTRDLEPFLADAPRSRILFTTRNQQIAAHVGATEYSAKLLDEKQSFDLLVKWSGISLDELPGEALVLIQECGRLPLAIATIGAMLHGQHERMWRTILKRLRRVDLAKLEADFPGYAHPDIFRSIQVSVNDLDELTRQCYLSLGVLLEDSPAALPILQLLWNQNETEALETARRLVSLSLAERQGEAIYLHDLHLDYVRALCPWREALSVIHDAIRLSSQVIHDDPRQFASQLVGRLFGLRNQPGVDGFIRILTRSAPFPYLRPLFGGLAPPGTPLRWILPWSSDHHTAISADGRRAVLKSDRMKNVIQKLSFSLEIWDLDEGKVKRTIVDEGISTFAIDPAALRAVSVLKDGNINIWNLQSGDKLGSLATGSAARRCALSDDGRFLVLLLEDGTLTRWDLEDRTQSHRIVACTRYPSELSVSGDSLCVVQQSTDTLAVWDLRSNQRALLLSVNARLGITDFAISRDGSRVCASHDDNLTVWDLPSVRPSHVLLDRYGFKAVQLTNDGRLCIASSRAAPFLKLWNLEDGAEVLMLRGHTQDIKRVSLSADGSRAISGSSDQTFRIWDLNTRLVSDDHGGHESPIGAVAATKDGLRAVSGALDGTLKIWDAQTGQQLFAIAAHNDWIRALTIRRENAVVSASDNMLAIWSLKTGRNIRKYQRFVLGSDFRENFAVVLTPDEKMALCAQSQETTDLVDLKTGRSIRKFQGPLDTEGEGWIVRGVAVTNDGKLVVTVSEGGIVRVWEYETGKLLRQSTSYSYFSSVVTLGDSQAIGGSRDLILWDIKEGAELFRFKGHTAPIWSVAVSSDGKRIASASFDRTLRVWDLNSRQEIATFTSDGVLRSCAFAASNKIVVGDAGGRVAFLEIVEPTVLEESGVRERFR